MPRTAVLLLAAGSGTRVGAGTNKVLLPMAGVPVLAWSLRTVTALEYVERLVVVHRDEDREAVADVVRHELPEEREATLVDGGATRHDSEWRGLQVLRDDVDAGRLDVVVIHDSARPLAGPALFDATVVAAHEHGGAIPVRTQPGLLHRQSGGPVAGVVGVQTPQAFRAGPLLEAYAAAEREGFTGTDTAACVERYAGVPVHCIPGDPRNVKVTYGSDLALAGRLLRP